MRKYTLEEEGLKFIAALIEEDRIVDACCLLVEKEATNLERRGSRSARTLIRAPPQAP